MIAPPAVFPEWERAEAARSAQAAAREAGTELRLEPRIVARYSFPSPTAASPLEYLFHLVGDVCGRKVLDYGCGSGVNTALLAVRGARVIGIDLSSPMLAITRRRLEVNGLRATLVAASAHSLPVASGSVDLVFGNAILHHLDLAVAAREICRVLRPGGRAIFREPAQNSKVVRAIRRLVPYRTPDVSPFERQLTDRELRDFAGVFASCRIRAFSLPFVRLGHLLPFVCHHVGPLYWLDRAMLRTCPPLAHFATIRVVEVTKPA